MSSGLDERIHVMMQQVVDESPLPPVLPEAPAAAARRPVPNWAIAVAAAVAALLILGTASLLLGGSDGSVVPLPPAEVTTTTASTDVAELTEPDVDDAPSQLVVRIDGVAEYTPADGIATGSVTGIEALADGSVWVVTVEGDSARNGIDCSWAISRFDGDVWEPVELRTDGTTPPPTAHCGGFHVESSSDGTVWISVSDELPPEALRWVAGRITSASSPEFGPVEGSAGLWSWSDGTWTSHGAVVDHPAGFSAIGMAALPDHLLTGQMWVGDQGTTWVLVIDPNGYHAFARHENGRWEIFNGTSGTARIGEIAWPCSSGGVDGAGRLWITGDGLGFVSFDGVVWDGWTDTGFCIPGVGPSAAGPAGELWWATESGLIRWDGETRTEWAVAETWTGPNPVTSFAFGQDLTVDSDGVVWIPSRGRLVRFDPATLTWSLLSSSDGIPTSASDPFAHADASGALWYRTTDGIAMIDVSVSEVGESEDRRIALEDLEWTEIELPMDGVAGAFEADIEGGGIHSALAAGDGRLFLGGGSTSYAHEERSLVWTSTDGRSWDLLDIRVGETSFHLENIAMVEGEYVAKGTGHDPALGFGPDAYRLEYWRSPDGYSWTLLEHALIDAGSELDVYFTVGEPDTFAPSLESTGLDTVFGVDAELERMLILEDRILIAGMKDGSIVHYVWIAPRP